MSPPTSCTSWVLTKTGAPLESRTRALPPPAPGHALIRVAGCGVCHTDLGFAREGVRTRMPPPIVLGHEIAGTVEAVGEGVSLKVGQQVVVPAVIPCGECELCRMGRENSCLKQLMPGNDGDGGFATHATMPARFLCPLDVPEDDLWMYGVVADAVATAYQAVDRARVQKGDTCIVVGTGGVGGFATQICAARGGTVVGLDLDEQRLSRLRAHGLAHGVATRGKDAKTVRGEVKKLLDEHKLSPNHLKIFETSGHPAGQEIALALVGPAALLAVVGYSMERIPVRLATFMAFDARLHGTWGCRPQLFPDVVKMCRQGEITLAPFIEPVPLTQVNTVLDELARGARSKRPVLIP